MLMVFMDTSFCILSDCIVIDSMFNGPIKFFLHLKLIVVIYKS